MENLECLSCSQTLKRYMRNRYCIVCSKRNYYFNVVGLEIIQMIMIHMDLFTLSKFVRTNKRNNHLSSEIFYMHTGKKITSYLEFFAHSCKKINGKFWRWDWEGVGFETSDCLQLKIYGTRKHFATVYALCVSPKINMFRFRVIRSPIQSFSFGCKVRKENTSLEFTIDQTHQQSSLKIHSNVSGDYSVDLPQCLSTSDKPCVDMIENIGSVGLNEYVIMRDQIYQMNVNFETKQMELSIDNVFVCFAACDFTSKQLYFYVRLPGATTVEAF